MRIAEYLDADADSPFSDEVEAPRGTFGDIDDRSSPRVGSTVDHTEDHTTAVFEISDPYPRAEWQRAMRGHHLPRIEDRAAGRGPSGESPAVVRRKARQRSRDRIRRVGRVARWRVARTRGHERRGGQDQSGQQPRTRRRG